MLKIFFLLGKIGMKCNNPFIIAGKMKVIMMNINWVCEKRKEKA